MLILKKDILKTAIDHARKEFPNEACGILSGTNGKVEGIFAMANVDKSPASYIMSPQEQFKVMKEIRNEGQELLAIYHSHVASQAYPSAKDVELAFYPEASYLIISLQEKDTPGVKSFKIKEGKILEEEIRLE